jgi:phenylpyruvate tautomerase PptA (4-oxalocrotonate tautomerase family)
MAGSTRGNSDGPKKPKRNTAPAQLRPDLTDMLAEIANHERQSVADLVEESPLRIWTVERYLRMKRQISKQVEELEKSLAALKAKQPKG